VTSPAGRSGRLEHKAQTAAESDQEVGSSEIHHQDQTSLPEAVDPLANSFVSEAVKAIYSKVDPVINKRKWRQAEAMLLDAVKSDKKTSGVYYRLAYVQFKQQKLSEAAKNIAASIELQQKNYYALNLAGIIARERGNFVEAKSFYQRALQAYPRFRAAHINLAILADIYLRDYELAKHHYELALALAGGKDETIEKWLLDLKRRMSVKENR
jgi:tetratricopeptide (TPR) repeat protein